MRMRRQIYLNNVPGADFATGQNNRHDPGFASDVSGNVAIQRRGHQAGHEAIELDTGIA